MSTTQKTLVIAEAGVNHNGDLRLAKKLIDAAKNAGADIVKFQTFKASKLATEAAEQAVYQQKAQKNAGGQVGLLSQLELKSDEFVELSDYSQQKGIEFLSTAFDSHSINLLEDSLRRNNQSSLSPYYR